MTLWTEHWRDISAWTGNRRHGRLLADGRYRADIPVGEHFGTDLRRPIPGGPRQASLTYDVWFSPNFNVGATWGGKMLGIADLRFGNSYGNKPTVDHGFSARGVWRPIPNSSRVRVGAYVYSLATDHSDGKTWGDEVWFGEISGHGSITINVDLDMELVSGAVNGVESPNVLPIVVSPETRCDIAWLDVYHGGSQVPTQNIWIDTGKVVCSTVEPPDEDLGMPVVSYGDGMTRNLDLRFDVERFQAWLAIAGRIAANTFDSQHRPDGKFGSGTRHATMDFQDGAGVPVTGTGDAATWRALARWGRP